MMNHIKENRVIIIAILAGALMFAAYKYTSSDDNSVRIQVYEQHSKTTRPLHSAPIRN